MIPVQMQVAVMSDSVGMTISDIQPISAELGTEYRTYQSYGGSYEITPGSSEQVLPTAGRLLSENITVAPVPQNYGLISWNGSYLTVS